MITTKRRRALFVILLACWGPAPAVQAAQQTFSASQSQLLDLIEQALPEIGVTVLNQARTDRFALLYAVHEQGTAVTLTLRQLPLDEARIDLTIATDSPADSMLEQAFLSRLRDALKPAAEDDN